MMKTIIKIFAVTALGLASCKKLDVTPPDRLSTQVFWQSAGDADLALTGIYSTLYAQSDGIDQYGPMWWENFSDNSYSMHSLGGSQNALISGLTSTHGGFQRNLYINSYITISSCNVFLNNVQKVLSGDQLTKYKAEAYFIRGFSYFMLAQTYGNVPIVSDEDPFSVDYNVKKAKSPREDVLKKAEADFDLAIASLSPTAYTTGHAVKASAQGFKVRLLLFEKRYSEAAALARTIINDGLFSLNSDYAANFYKPGQNSSPEIMFSVKYDAPAAPHPNSLTTYLINPGYVDLQGTQDLINEYEPNDPRKTMTFFFPGDTRAQGWPFTNTVATPGVNGWTTGFYVAKKWLDPKNVDPQPGILDNQDNVLLRYADVKLMYAEAQNEAVGPDESVYRQVNEVRARPGVNMPALAANLNKDDMRIKIQHERRVELALEGQRYFDLRRWGLAKEKLNGFVQNPLIPTVKTIYKDAYDFWPLPQEEIDINNPTLKQNTGY